MPVVNVSSDEVRAAVSMREVIDALRAGFVALDRGEFEMPVRTALHDGQFLVMPVLHRPTRSAVVKTLSIDPDRTPVIAGTVAWSELGRPDALIADAGAVTALRTGAAVGVATDLLADPAASTLTLFGAGAQALDQVRAVHEVRPLRELVVLDTGSPRVATLIAQLQHDLPDVRVHRDPDARSALAGADIVCCATPATSPLFDIDALRERVHVNAIGSYRPVMRELPDSLLAASTVVVDDADAVLEESGEILHALRAGVLAVSDLVPLGAALSDPPPPSPRTVFKSVGLAMQDWVVARLLADRLLPDRTET
jgi:ornithine cyclodeaminase